MPGILVLGARNLGGAIAARFLAEGWKAAAVARSEETLAAVRERGALAIGADASDADSLAGALARAREELGSLDCVVNAVSASRPPEHGPFGGGPFSEATMEGLRGWAHPVVEQAFAFLSEGSKALRVSGGGTLIQVTGGSSRRAMPGKGLWAAGAFGTRALTQSAALELRGEGVHVALLVVDAVIDRGDDGTDATADEDDIAAAAFFLASQTPRSYTHELVVTPAGDTWVP